MKTIFYVFGCIIFSNPVYAHENNEKLNEFFTHYSEYGSFSGVVLAAENGRIIYHKAFGFKDYEKKLPMDTSAVFNIASTTKPLTAIAIMMLKEQGKLSYDDTLAKFFPDYPAYGDKITIRHLLTHTSGIPDFTNEMLLHHKLPVMTTQVVYDSLKAQDSLNFEPGAKYRYNNSGYFLLALIIEKITGKSYRDYVNENIFIPLGMNNTYAYDEWMTDIPDRVHAYSELWEKDDNDMKLQVPGEGNIYTTASDLFLFEQALYDDRLVQTETMAEAYDTEDLFVNERNGTVYGFGWHIKHDSTGTVVYHHGGNGGFRCQLWRCLDKKNVLIVLSNNTFLSSCPGILAGAQKIMKGEQYSLGQIPVSHLFYRTWHEQDFDAAMNAVMQERNDRASVYEFDEMDINMLGYFFMERKEHHEAIEVFKMNVELYPESSNVYDSLGEAYMEAGEKALAIINYEKSLELDPGNTGAVKMLEELRKTK